jgi:hypothetical protein
MREIPSSVDSSRKGRLLHPSGGQISVHGLPDEFGEARRKDRATEAHAAPEVTKRPWLIWMLVNQLKRRSDMRVAHRPKPSALAGAEGLDPAS